VAVSLVVGGTAGAGLLLDGYPGAVLVPAVAAAARIPPPGWRQRTGPWLLGGLFTIALVIGAIGQRLVLARAAAPPVPATAHPVPEVLCLIVVGGLAAMLIDTALIGTASPDPAPRPPSPEREP